MDKILKLVIYIVVMSFWSNEANFFVAGQCNTIANCTKCQPHGTAECTNICPSKVTLPMDIIELKLTSSSCNYMKFGMLRPEDFALYTSIEKVDLSNNHIKSLYYGPPKFVPTFMNMPNVKVMSLTHNELRSANTKIFFNLSKLEELDLSYNVFQAIIFNNTAETWPSIKILKLDNNNLTAIAADTFAAVNKLETLILSNNPITSINDDAFKLMTNLHTIHIDGLPLKEIPAALFANPQTLKEVIASNMDVSSLSDNILHGTSLDKMDLSKDQFTSIPTTAIKNSVNQPKSLDLSNNKITQISNTDLQGLTVETLDLSGNPIVAIEDKAFDGCTVAHIDLSNTGLTSLPVTMETWLKSTTTTVNLDITNWSCTCDTIWLARLVDQKTNITPPPKCAISGKYGGTSLNAALRKMEADCTAAVLTNETTPKTTKSQGSTLHATVSGVSPTFITPIVASRGIISSLYLAFVGIFVRIIM